MTVNKIISVFKLRTTRIWMRIFILYLKIFFAYSLIFLILLWFKICWGNFEIFVTDMLQFFLLNTSKWMLLISDKFLTRKVKKRRKLHFDFLKFYWKIYTNIFYWKLCENRKEFSISNFWIHHWFTWLMEIFV